MILSDKAAAARLGSPNNLMNRLSELKNKPRKNAMSLFVPTYKRDNNEREELREVPKVTNPFDASASPAKVTNPFDRAQREDSIEVKTNPTVVTSISDVDSPDIIPTIEQLVSNSDEQIQLNLAHNKALEVLNLTLDSLKTKLPDISAGKLPAAITAASRVVTDIRRERLEAKKTNGKDADVHFHFYTPQQRKVSEYEVIDVTPPPVEQGIY